MPDGAALALALAVLVATLATAVTRPPYLSEAVVAAAGALLLVAVGALSLDRAGDALRDLGPTVAFLAALLLIADGCRGDGLFAAMGSVMARGARGRPQRLLAFVFAIAAAITAVLSLDATVVLLTPVVIGAAVAMGTSSRPGAYACLRMANSASLLLPVSNLTNLLALPHLRLTFGGFALVMAPVLAAVLVVEYVVLRFLFRTELADSRPHPDRHEDVAVPAVPVATVGLMLLGFAVLSPLGVEPFWVSTAAAVALAGWARSRGLLSAREVVHAAHPSFAVFVLSLGVVVAAISEGFLGEAVAGVLPTSTSYAALVLIAVVATVLANLLTNLSATLLLVPLLAPLGVPAVLAALLGLNIGSGLTYTGSLANLLWRRGLVRQGVRPGMWGFHRVSLVATPLSLLAAVSVLALVT